MTHWIHSQFSIELKSRLLKPICTASHGSVIFIMQLNEMWESIVNLLVKPLAWPLVTTPRLQVVNDFHLAKAKHDA